MLQALRWEIEALTVKLLLRRSLSPTWSGHPNPEVITINSSVQVQSSIFKWADCLWEGHLSLDFGPTLIQMVSPGYLTLITSARSLLPNKITSWGSGQVYLWGATIQPMIVDISLSYFFDRIVFPLSIGNKQKRAWLAKKIYVNPWLIHLNVWQKPLQYCKVVSLQLIKINEKKSRKKKKLWLGWSPAVGRSKGRGMNKHPRDEHYLQVLFLSIR